MSNPVRPLKAIRMLVLCTALWAVSFPAMKALAMAQQASLPAGSSWFFASLCVVYRFGLSALFVLLSSARTIGGLTRSEVSQGLGLGLFGGAGILVQMDGLAHTSASTSAFLTQCYCLFIPLWVAIHERRRPKAILVLCCAMVMAGVAVLARLNWRDLRIGRGEVETILASVLFSGQILWLERPKFARNNVNHFSAVMFTAMSLVGVPVASLTAPQPADWIRAYSSAATLGLLGILVLFCTLGAFMLMNRWQRHITATQASLIYCLEPVFASACALFLPAWFSAWASVNYANEHLTPHLLIGGGLIVAANVLIVIRSCSDTGAAAKAGGDAPDRRQGSPG